MNQRRKARTVALQALYEIDCTSHTMAQVMEQRLLEQPLEPELNEFAVAMVGGVVANTATLDGLIQTYAPEWPLDQMALIDRNILRIAIWEFAGGQTTPMKVAINEAVELAKLYGSDSAPRFVNGVLGALAVRQADVTQHFNNGGSAAGAGPTAPAE